MRRVAAVLLCLGFGWAGAGAADSLPDPTRPPDFAPRAPRAATAGPTGPVLQTTLVGPGRKTAIISGQHVQVGDTFQGAVITDISAYEVRMSKGGRETRLRLLPKLTKETGNVE